MDVQVPSQLHPLLAQKCVRDGAEEEQAQDQRGEMRHSRATRMADESNVLQTGSTALPKDAPQKHHRLNCCSLRMDRFYAFAPAEEDLVP